LADDLGQDYSMLSKLFSEKKERQLPIILLLKIERAKALLLYNEMTLSEIAIQLNYSSVAHLSSQFKKKSGYTLPIQAIKDNTRNRLMDYKSYKVYPQLCNNTI
jgi:AraC-like DNA-binding protein